MSRANPFNKDKTVIEDELKRRRDQRDRYYNEGHYFTWILSNIQYYAFQYPAVAFYRNQEAKTAEWRAKHGTPLRYHPIFPRVKRVDQCETDDVVCVYEADQQMYRDRIIDEEIIAIMKLRMDACLYTNPVESHIEKCEEYKLRLYTAMDLYDVKYGDLPFNSSSIAVLMKQKDRLMKEREGSVIYPPFVVDTGGRGFEKISVTQPVNKEYPINPFPLPEKFTYNGRKSSET